MTLLSSERRWSRCERHKSAIYEWSTGINMMKIVVSLLNEEKFAETFEVGQASEEGFSRPELFVQSRDYEAYLQKDAFGANPFVVGLHRDFNLAAILRSWSRFFIVNVVNTFESAKSASRRGKLVLYASSRTLSRHFPDEPSNEFYLKVISAPVPLSKVVLGVKSADRFRKLVADDAWETKIRVAVCNPNWVSLCRANEDFLGDADFQVIESEPVLQGVVDLNTELILTQLNDHGHSRKQTLARANFGKLVCHSPILTKTTASFSFKIILLDKPLSLPGVDVENGAVVLSRHFVSVFGLTSGSWVKVWLQGRQDNQRIARVIESEFDGDELAYISPLLWFNLNHRSAPKESSPLLQSDARLVVSCHSSDEPPSYAKEAHIALVQSPDYTGDADYAFLLRNYFGEKRVILKHDILAVPLKYDPQFYNRNQDVGSVGWPVVYFMVSKIEGQGCLFDVEHSKLYQTGTTRAFVPASLKNYYYELEEVNFGLMKRQTENLASIFAPYFKSLTNSTAAILLSGPSGSGKTVIVRNVCKFWNLHLFDVDCNSLLCDTPAATDAKVRNMFNKWSCFFPCVLMLTNFDILCRNSSGMDPRIRDAFEKQLQEAEVELPNLMVVLTAERDVVVNSDLGSIFTHEIKVENLDEKERLEHLQMLFEDQLLSKNVQLDLIAKQTAGFVLDDLKAVARKSMLEAYRRTVKLLNSRSEYDVALSGVLLSQQDIEVSLREMQKLYNESIGAPTIPNVQWDDIGALSDVKKEIMDAIQLPLAHPELLHAGLKRSGVLLYGPPGTGKTLIAKAVASQCNINFLSVKGPEIINMYIGQSEENVRNLFARARSAAPCVVFFDELDSVAPNRGKSGDSGGVMDRVVSQLLSEIDGVNRTLSVFIIGATNRPDLLDPALLRPGRFDRLVFVGVAKEPAARIDILRALTRKFTLEPGFSYENLESKCPPCLTGADFYSICSGAMMFALGRCVKAVEALAETEENCEIVVQMSDFVQCLKSIKPSVTMEDVVKYELIKAKLR